MSAFPQQFSRQRASHSAGKPAEDGPDLLALPHIYAPVSEPPQPPEVNFAAKLLRHHENIAGIQTGQFLPPVMVDVDLVDGVCNLDCAWCCQAQSRASRPARYMSEETMRRLGPFCHNWGVKAWRISGDSEPTLNRNIDVLIRSGQDAGIDMGLITNGVFLERLTTASALTYLGISLDATTSSTWSRLKRSPASNFRKIIDNVKQVRQECPQLDICIKFVRFQADESLGKNDFSNSLSVLDNSPSNQTGNGEDAEQLDKFSRDLGCRPILKEAYPKGLADSYVFSRCNATPLGGVFDASHNFHLCCDARSVYVLTDDYTRDDWRELPALWGSEKHQQLIESIIPRRCEGCAKRQVNEILQHVVMSSHCSSDYQVNFI